MAGQQTPRTLSEKGDLEKNQSYEAAGPDHEVDEDHSDNDDGSSHGTDHDDGEDPSDLTQPITRERTGHSRRSVDLRRSASHALSAVVSRVTTRGWPEPPPPPDGGIKAWTQVACVCFSASLLEIKSNARSQRPAWQVLIFK